MEEEKKKKSIARRIFVPSWSDFGFKPMIDSFNSISNTFGAIKKSLRKKEYKPETFEEARIRANLSDSDIADIKKNLTITSWMFASFGVFCFIQAMYFLIFKHSISSAIPSSVFTVFFSLACFKFSFRVYQLKIKKLCSANEFLNSGEFIPRTIK